MTWTNVRRWTPRRRAFVAGSVLAAFALLLMGLGGAAWCDDARFGYFVQSQRAPSDVPAVDFTVDDAETYPDIQRALDAVGLAVRAEDPVGTDAFLANLTEQGAAAVRVREGNFYLSGYEQTPSETWVAVCT